MNKGLHNFNIGGKIKDPGCSCDFKTGSWAYLRPKLNKEKCSKCFTCVKYCPENCISFKNNELKINYDFCKGCGICSRECPAGAIIMKISDNDFKDN